MISSSPSRWLLTKTVFPAVRERGDHVTDFAPADGIDSVRRFVEDDQIRIRGERLGEPGALHHPLGIGGDLPIRVVGHADGFQQFRGAAFSRRAIDLGKGGEEFDHLPPGEITGKSMAFGKVADARQRRLVADRRAENSALGASRPRHRHHDFNECALPSPVRPEQPEYLSLPYPHVHARKGVNASAVNLRHISKVYSQRVGHRAGLSTGNPLMQNGVGRLKFQLKTRPDIGLITEADQFIGIDKIKPRSEAVGERVTPGNAQSAVLARVPV